MGLDGAVGPPLSGAHRVVSGGGQLGYLYCDATTCLSIGLGPSPRVGLGPAGCVAWPAGVVLAAPEGGPPHRRTDQPTRPREGTSGALVASGAVGQGLAPHTRWHRPRRSAPLHRVQIQNLEFQTADSVAGRWQRAVLNLSSWPPLSTDRLIRR